MSALGLRSLVALLSVVLAASVLGLTLGLWERSSILIADLRDVVGRTTWLVSQVPVVGEQPPPLSGDEAAYDALRALPGVTHLGLATGSTRLLGSFNYPLIGVNRDFFAVRRLELAEGRWGAGVAEALVGQDQRDLFGQVIEIGAVGAEGRVRVVGVLAPVVTRDPQDLVLNQMVFVPLEGYRGPSGTEWLAVETTPEAFGAVGEALDAWLGREGVQGFEVQRLADRYGVALRDQVAKLLQGALGFGVAAALLAAGANLLAFFFAAALARVRQSAVRRALGASRREIVLEEVLGAWPWVALGLGLALPTVLLVAGWLERTTGLAAYPGPWSYALLGLGVSSLVTVAALIPTWWLVYQPPAVAMRGLASGAVGRRMWLAGIGLALGVAGLVLQASSARAAVLETERMLGQVSERVGVLGSLIGPGASAFGDPRAAVSPTPRDYEALLASPEAAALSRTAYTVRHLLVPLRAAQAETRSDIRAYTGDFPGIVGAQLEAGRWPLPTDAEIALGQTLAATLFGVPPGEVVGQSLEAFGQRWRVVGIFATGEAGIPGGVSNADALAPLERVRARSPFSVASFAVEVAAGRDVALGLQAAADALSARYDPARFLPFSVIRPEGAAALSVPVRATLQTLSAVYRALAVALLLLGGAGLAAQMLVALSLRVREVGIRRAVGAGTWAIFRQFLQEALTLGLLAGLLGLALGIGFSRLLAARQGVVFALDWTWNLLGLAVVLAVAASFAAGPSWLAARLAPAKAMREASE